MNSRANPDSGEWGICHECGSSFWRDSSWKTLCLSCWKASQPATPGHRRHTGRLLELEKENASLRREIARLRQYATLDPDMLSRLVRLCHPDRHGNSEASNKATAWLLARREGAT
jgi:hypothetical protein